MYSKYYKNFDESGTRAVLKISAILIQYYPMFLRISSYPSRVKEVQNLSLSTL